MRLFCLASVTLLAVILASCGSSSSPSAQNINGTYSAFLVTADNAVALSFSASLAQTTGSSVSATNYAVLSPSPCFGTAAIQSATFSPTGSSGGFQTGPFTMTVTTLFPTTNNVATLMGTRGSNGNISGTWTATGMAGCGGSGTFQMALPIMPPAMSHHEAE